MNFEFLLHSRNYLMGDIINKGLAFISIPIFTRLFLTSDYGIVSIFLSSVSYLVLFLHLNFHSAIKRYYFEEADDFPSFLGTNLVFIITFNVICFFILSSFKKFFAGFLNVSEEVIVMIILSASLSVPWLIYLQLLNIKRESKKYATISIINSIATLTLSVAWVSCLTSDRYMGKIYANVLVHAVFAILFSYILLKEAKFDFQFKYLKYSLLYGIPLLIHGVSGVILPYFDRIIINQLKGASDSGLYSFAYNVGMIMSVAAVSLNRSWTPIFYDLLKNRKYDEIEKVNKNYSKYIYLIAVFLILFSGEIVMIMASKNYYSALDLVPIIIVSYVFWYMYTIYANYSFYYKNTGTISLITFIAGMVNIGLNYWLIPIYGYKVAALTTLASYFLMFLMHLVNVKLFFKHFKTVPIKTVAAYFPAVLLATAIFYSMEYLQMNLFLKIFIKIVLISLTAIFFWKERARGLWLEIYGSIKGR